MNKRKLSALLLSMTMLISTSTLTTFAKDEESGMDMQNAIAETEHHWNDEEWIYDQNFHFHGCTDEGCTEKKDFARHDYRWIVKRPATETKKGWMCQGCFCGYEAFSASLEIPVLSVSPVFSANSDLYTKGDITLNVDTKGGQLGQIELEFSMKSGDTIGTSELPYETNLDNSGKGTITFKQSELEKALNNLQYKLENVNHIHFSTTFLYDTNEAENVEQISTKTIDMKVDFKIQPVYTTITESASGVNMVLPDEAAKGLTLNVTVSDGKNVQSAIQNAINKVITIADAKIRTYDLSLLKDGNPYVYNGQFNSTVSLPIPQGWNVNQLALFYFNENTNEVTPVEFTVDPSGAFVTFKTNHFSKYVLTQKATTSGTENVTKPTNPTVDTTTSVKTGDTSTILLWSIVAAISLAGGITALFFKRRRNV